MTEDINFSYGTWNVCYDGFLEREIDERCRQRIEELLDDICDNINIIDHLDSIITPLT